MKNHKPALQILPYLCNPTQRHMQRRNDIKKLFDQKSCMTSFEITREMKLPEEVVAKEILKLLKEGFIQKREIIPSIDASYVKIKKLS